jgi:hypothetical protein
MMDLQLLHDTAVLATPTVSFQHLLSDLGMLFRASSESWLPLA